MSLLQKTLGKSGTKVSAPGFGAMSLSGAWGPADDETSLKLLQKAIDIGCTFWDTSDAYGKGHNEELLAKILATQREKVFLCTKFGIVSVNFEKGIEACGKASFVKESCEKSLKRLGVSQIDLYYYHRVDVNTPIEETMQALKELQAEGKIKYIGISECSAKTLRAACKVVHVDALQVEYSPFTLDIEQNGLLDACRELGVCIVAFSPLGKGILTGHIKSSDELPANDLRKATPRFQGENFTHNMTLVSELGKLAAKKGCTTSQLCIAWVMAQGDDFIPIPGTKREKYLIENVESASVKLSKEEVAEIRGLIEDFKVVGIRYPESILKSCNV